MGVMWVFHGAWQWVDNSSVVSELAWEGCEREILTEVVYVHVEKRRAEDGPFRDPGEELVRLTASAVDDH